MEMEKEPIKEEVSVVDMPHNRGQKIAIGLLLVGLCVVLAYAFREHSSAKQIAASRNELTAALNQERGQVETLTEKLNAAESVPAAAPQPSLNSQTEAASSHHQAKESATPFHKARSRSKSPSC